MSTSKKKQLKEDLLKLFESIGFHGMFEIEKTEPKKYRLTVPWGTKNPDGLASSAEDYIAISDPEWSVFVFHFFED